MNHFGTDVFNIKKMKETLSVQTMISLEKTINEGGMLDREIAQEIARAMLDWATKKGATHYTHWFQPLTGSTAEKHESFLNLTAEQLGEMKFSTEQLILGEPDASSFPSGGLRATFEARGYSAWDPTSPAFIIRGKRRATLCIPSIFLGYHSEALDKKTPLLRSIRAISEQILAINKIFGDKEIMRNPYVTLGTEQEYFLIDRKYFDQRPDLRQTGRTLFGSIPAKHQQQEDHYFGSIKSRVISFMEELDEKLWALGIPAKTRHNEVAPGQYELAPIFEEMNLAVDHNMLTMDIMCRLAEEKGLVVLLHEKPFAGINGSGKHNNWSIVGPDGRNWLQPGETPEQNAKFLTLICAIICGVDMHEDLLRLSIASSGNDHRLGGNEAPPPIISIFLGDELTRIIEQIEAGEKISTEEGGFLEVRLDRLPSLERDTTDRNRTSPLAYTGSKFEFRGVGAAMNPAGPNIIMNMVIADGLESISQEFVKEMSAGKEYSQDLLQTVLQRIIKKHKRILFNGNNYSKEWIDEAARRGLSNYKNTAEALEVLKVEKNIQLFEKYNILSKREQKSRYEIYLGRYFTEINIEKKCAIRIAQTMIVPAVVKYLGDLRHCQSTSQKKLLQKVSDLLDQVLEKITQLENIQVEESLDEALLELAKLREHIDSLEELTSKEYWPLPSYEKMLLQNV